MISTLNRWVLAPGTRARAYDTAVKIGERLLRERNAVHTGEDIWQWELERGLARTSGFALTYMALWQATQDERYETAMHQSLREAITIDDAPTIALFSGISGLRAVAAMASTFEPGYERVVEQCDAYVDTCAVVAHEKPEDFGAYDVIAGAAGARLARCITAPAPPDGLSDFLAWLIAYEDRWALHHPLRRHDPVENDLCMAHGLAGMLASLALTLDEIEPGLQESMGRAAHALAECAIYSGGVAGWAPAMQDREQRPYRAAWCFGALGVLASLSSVAQRLKDGHLLQFVRESTLRVAAQPTEAWMLGDFALCHGYAGNALTFASIGAAAEIPEMQPVVERLIVETIDGLEAADGRCWAGGIDVPRFDAVGVLEGVAGIALALLTLADERVDATWMKCYALQPVR